MDLLTNTNIDFMGLRRFLIPLSAVLVGISIVLLLTGSLNMGIDFAGGTQMIVRFRDDPEIDEIRDLFSAGGFDDPPTIQRFGEVGDRELIIRTRLTEDSEEGSQGRVTAVLEGRFGSGPSQLELNLQGQGALAAFLLQRDPDSQRAVIGEDPAEYYDAVAASIMDLRRQQGLIASWAEIEALDLSPDVLAALRADASLGGFSVLSAENVGPQIGSELRRKGILAILFSLVGMTAYIWIRFELRFGLGALVALVHDVLIALGLYVVLGYEFNLTTIAAFLTLVGYSVNDSVVIFDRVRENRRQRRRESFAAVINTSLNQTLSRTLLTSGTTLLALTTMFLFGGDVLRGFSFVLMTGVIVGTYSSIFVASPVVLAWERFQGRQR